MLHNTLAIVIGASTGALVRWGLNRWLAPISAPLSVGTLAANWLGAYLIGIIAATLDGLPQLNPNIKLLLITGFLGSMTTLSGVSLEITGMLQSQRWLTALATASLHLFGSLLLTFLGITTVNLFRQ